MSHPLASPGNPRNCCDVDARFYILALQLYLIYSLNFLIQLFTIINFFVNHFINYSINNFIIAGDFLLFVRFPSFSSAWPLSTSSQTPSKA